MRSVLAVAAWLATVLMDALMYWVLTAGGFLDQMAAGQPAVTGDMRALTYASLAAFVAVTLSYATVGLLLATRSGAGRIGTVLLAGGLSFAAIPFGYVVGGSLVLREPFDPLSNVVFLIGPAAIATGYSLILPVVALIFPHGTLPSRRWRWPVRTVGALLATATMITVLRPGEIAGAASRNPLGVPGFPSALAWLGDVFFVIGIVAISMLGVASVVVRYRQGTALLRRQLRWFVAAVLLAAGPLLLGFLPGTGGPQWALIASFGLLLVPVSVWIAVTRHGLYEIDRLISRGLSWGLLTGVLVAVYAGVVLVLQGALAGVTQGQTLAVAASTLLAAALFQPLRVRVQHAVDRRFNRARYDAQREADAFGARLRDEVDLDAVARELRLAAGRTVAPSTATVWLRSSVSNSPSSLIS